MSSVELMLTVADHAEYLIASQETEPIHDRNYAVLAECGTITPKSLAVRLVDSYMQFYEELYAQGDVTGEDLTLYMLLSRGESFLKGTYESTIISMSGIRWTVPCQQWHMNISICCA